ncbi:hypothetical protein MWH28_07860 [Natroniella sulfidigena]|uniref:hypothetical protein n=1 Tax=Natroniella sulfidigena TaxID=723921 RepID=UPI00200A0B17|nr:hypothetical protein [Natroniella sulfidigena]MCK8817275.1 hypothetical protein [Natroniella sulfidigena]
MKECVLEHKACEYCGECLLCDMNSNKKCDNCMKCIEGESNYRGIKIDEVQYDEPQSN